MKLDQEILQDIEPPAHSMHASSFQSQEEDSSALPTSRQASKGIPLLLVEDEAGMAAEIAAELSDLGYQVQIERTGPAGLAAARSQAFSLLIIDRMLPETDGLTLIEILRQENILIPVLVVSALSSVDEKIRGLKAGGDDYLTKPFAMGELAARVEALLRRPADLRSSILRVGPLEMDLIERSVRRDNRLLDLLPREFKLLEYLMRRPGQTVTRAMLLEDVWNYNFLPQTNLVDVHIGKLRKKIDQPGSPPLIESVRGAGFRLRA
ncbi:response regulator transcription factor [Beijerinckia mobilis]|uniref:response regulator transcription factor n=1 Tax=Beijerinckia mobilis TaxID=231434 RepID=UPI002477D197|nr:response regulator transcription factor [Beijerinckia mobilis]